MTFGQTAAIGSTKKTIAVRAPASGEALGEVPVMDGAEVRQVVERARVAQRAWAVIGIEERVERLYAFRDAIVEHADELATLLSKETGKPKIEALTHEIVTLVDAITWYLKRAPSALEPEELELHLLKHRRGIVEYVPRGVVGIISPWNFPLVTPFGDAAAALVTGSAVVVKPSEVTPLIALSVKKIWDESGLPEDLLAVVTGGGETGASLIAAGVDKIVFTGGVETGKKVARACGERLIECVMELGGKAPLIACEDADVERTARAIVYGGFVNSGQACIAVERVYAHAAIYDRLAERVSELTDRLRQGDPEHATVDVGAITFAPQADIVEGLVKDAIAKGAKLRVGGKRRPGPGTFFEPTVLSDCSHEMRVMKEEIFGPIVPIMKVESEERAIELANDSHLGLNAYVFSRDRDKARRIAERLTAGSVVVNDVLSNYATTEAPFGGVRESGYGRVHGEQALRAMCHVRYLSFDRLPAPAKDPLWYPYSDRTYDFMLRGLKALFTRKGVIGRIRELF